MDKDSAGSLKKKSTPHTGGDVSYSEVLAEVKRLQDLLAMEKRGDPALPSDFNYRNTLYALRYYKLKLSSWKKSERQS
jgi:hypothetical protein